MAEMTKRTTVCLDARLHRALRIKSTETSQSMSELVNEAVALALAEDAQDLAAIRDRAHEPLIAFEDVRRELHRHGKVRGPTAASRPTKGTP
jgi:hypothetical protein